jgi:hypothetical protein
MNKQQNKPDINAPIKEATYDEIFKEYILKLPDPLIIDMINSIFHRDFDHAAKVVRLDKESVKDYEKKISDTYLTVLETKNVTAIKVEEDFFHFEAQSTEDDSMSLRVLEYAFMGARTHSTTTAFADGVQKTKMKLPRSVAIYLRSKDTTPVRLDIEIEATDLEGNKSTLDWKIPTVRMGDYNPEKLSDERLYVMLPFFPMKFSYELRKKHGVEAEEQLKKELDDFRKVVNELAKREIITESLAVEITKTAKLIGEKMIKDNEFIIDRKGVEQAMENVVETVPYQDIVGYIAGLEAKNEAEAAQAERYKALAEKQAAKAERYKNHGEHIQKAFIENALRLYADNMPIPKISMYCNLPVSDINILISQNAERLAQMRDDITAAKTKLSLTDDSDTKTKKHDKPKL